MKLPEGALVAGDELERGGMPAWMQLLDAHASDVNLQVPSCLILDCAHPCLPDPVGPDAG